MPPNKVVITQDIVKFLFQSLGLTNIDDFLNRPVLQSEIFDIKKIELLLSEFNYEVKEIIRRVERENDINIHLTSSDIYLEIKGKLYNKELKHIKKIPGTDYLTYNVFHSDANNSLISVGNNWFWKLLFTYKKHIIVILLLSFLLAMTSLIVPGLISMFYTQMGPSGETHIQLKLYIGSIFVVITVFGYSLLRILLVNQLSMGVSSKIVREVFRRLLHLPLSLTEISPISSQLSRIKDFEGTRKILSIGRSNTIYDIPFVLILVFAMFYFAGSVAWIPVTSLVVFFIFTILMAPSLKRVNEHLLSCNNEYQQFLLELTTKVEYIQICKGRDAWENKYHASLTEVLKSFHYYTVIHGFISIFSTSIISVSGLATVSFGVYQVIHGNMTGGELMASLILVWRILGPIGAGVNFVSQFSNIKRSVQQLEKYMRIRLEERKNFQLDNRKIFGGVRFNNVSLRYNKDSKYALINVSFDLPAGKGLGLIGPGGSGKSSIAKLIMSLYSPQMGTVLISNQNVDQFDKLRLRKSIGYLPTMPKFNQETIIECFDFNTEFIGQEKYQRFYETLGLDKHLGELPKGLNSLLLDIDSSKRNILLKKIILLNIAMKDQNIVILDEPLSGCDRNEQDAILNWIYEYRSQCTMLTISNDPEVLQLMDRAIILEKGRVSYQGRPREMVKIFTNYQKDGE